MTAAGRSAHSAPAAPRADAAAEEVGPGGSVEVLLGTGRGVRPDPRTALVAVVVLNGAALSVGELAPSLMAGVIGWIALASIGTWGLLSGFACAELVCVACLYLVPLAGPSVLGGVVVTTAYWVLRVTVATAVAVYAVKVVQPGELLVALRSMRVPVALTVPVLVLLRFVPVAAKEYRAVRDAMVLRGIAPGMGVLLHPLRFLEHLLVPFLASCTRVADEMTAAATLRGLGSTARPTSLTRLRPGLPDAVWVLALVVTVAASRFLIMDGGPR